MISNRVLAAMAVGVLVVGILAGAAGSVLLGRASGPGPYSGDSAYGMMGTGPWSHDEMLNEMREHMGWPAASPDASDEVGR